MSIDEPGGGGQACGKSISQRRKSDVPVNQATIDGHRRQPEAVFSTWQKGANYQTAQKLPASKNNSRTLEEDENSVFQMEEAKKRKGVVRGVQSGD